MTGYDDNLLAAQFAALAPEPLEGRWDEVLREATATRDDGSRVERSAISNARRRYLVAFVAAVLVAVAGTAAYGTVRVLILDQGFVGLPPVGATPSTPESGDLVVEWFAFAEPLSPEQEGKDMVRAWVYADGRIIWDRRAHNPAGRRIPEGANEFTSGYLEQRLTSKGVELVRAAAAKLVDQSRALVEEIPAGDDPWWGHHPRFALVVPDDYVSAWGLVAVPNGDRSAQLFWIGNHESGYGTDDSVFEGTLATPEQLSALRRLAALINDPAAVLPSSAWAVRKIRAYVPSHYAVCIYTAPPKDASSELLSLLPTRAAELLRDKSRTQSADVATSGVGDCYKVETEDAREVADALSGLVREEGWGTHWLRWRLDEAPEGTSGNPTENPTDVSIEPYFPDGRIPTSGPFG